MNSISNKPFLKNLTRVSTLFLLALLPLHLTAVQAKGVGQAQNKPAIDAQQQNALDVKAETLKNNLSTFFAQFGARVVDLGNDTTKIEPLQKARSLAVFTVDMHLTFEESLKKFLKIVEDENFRYPEGSVLLCSNFLYQLLNGPFLTLQGVFDFKPSVTLEKYKLVSYKSPVGTVQFAQGEVNGTLTFVFLRFF